MDRQEQMMPLKNIDSVHRSLLLKAFFVSFPLLAVLGWSWLGTKGIWLAAAVSLCAAIVAVALAGRLGKAAGGLYGGRRPQWSTAEQYAADLSRARVQKMHKNYTEALQIIEAVLDAQPSFNEAWFLKAQILLEGFDFRIEARSCLVKIFQTEPKSSRLYQYSADLYREIVGVGLPDA